MNRHAVPYAELSLRQVTDDAKKFLVIRVAGFPLIPIVCGTGALTILNKGVIYIRSRRMHESTAIEDEGDLRELSDLATDKWSRYRA